MIIQSLELENFKNQKHTIIRIAEKGATNIYGANGVGKTTVLDALAFLLWGKDHKGGTSTNVRPYNETGELLHDIETNVKGVFNVNGYDFTLQIIYKEKWTKISGTDERKLTGNTTEYLIDGVPKKAKEYAAFVAEYFFEPWFTLTSNPTKFPNLDWQEQRKILLDLVGDISNDDIMEAHPELEEIRSDLEKFGVDDLKAKLNKEKKEYAKKIVELPARIDERRKSLTGLANAKAIKAEAEITLLKAKEPLEKLQMERAAIVNGTRKSELESKISVIKAKQEVIRSIRRERLEAVKAPYIIVTNNIDNDCKAKEAQLTLMRKQLMGLDSQLVEQEASLKVLTDEWQCVDAEVFADHECPCCHRPYSDDMLQPMLEQFNKSKAERLNRLDERGVKLAADIQSTKTEKGKLLLEINKLGKFSHEDAPQLRRDNAEAMAKAIAEVPPLEEFIHPETHEKFWDLAEGLKLRERDLDSCQIDIKLQLQAIDEKIAAAKAPVDKANEMLTRLKMDEETNEAIVRLESEKQNAMIKQGDVEYKLALIGKYLVAKMDMLDGKINSTFQNLSFRLFEKNIGNDGIRETCELMMHGVPYRQLSNAEKCQAGMEVVRVISERLKLDNPVFIDNREGITHIGNAPGQVINLFVSPEDKELRITYG